ncbi:helix-turn-helix domain-containing protein [Corynebacterium guangdongense]|uniref:AraC-like DNA-binding protein n=1 Tax=Corynebacterium guangdongense TaxID=1783348 RepID=A0ABU1ZTR6_9CORY|nr:helix-turn-helix domain-containing protein [Corynebacterium guangdongense]MDR7328328.1 AraC-like DNA-binding protein [Corynebacterium guangdongense]WJZ16906.1 Transcriptional activator FeaR [Corynebacterium guangdongense]
MHQRATKSETEQGHHEDRQPLDVWGENVGNNVLSFQFATPSTQEFRGNFESANFLSASVFAMSAGDHAAERTLEHVRNDPDEYLIVTFQIAGVLTLTQDDRRITVPPGQFGLYLSSRPVLLECYGNYESRSVRIPLDRFTAGLIEAEDFGARAFDASSGMAPPVLGFLTGLFATDSSLATSTRAHVANHLVSMVEAMLADAHLPDREITRSASGKLLEECVSHIEEHLSDSRLNPQMVADAAHISTRYLQQIFRQSGMTCANYIRFRRIDRVRSDLANPEFALDPIEKLLQRWGVQNPSHFGQVFRRIEGCTPTEFRKRALGRKRII